jgi:hypothetical protein
MLARSRLPILSILLLALVTACSGDKDPAATPAKAAEPTKEKKRSNVKSFVSPVPYGKQVACTDLVDGGKFATFLGVEVGEVKDRSSSNGEATAVCALFLAGTPPSAKQQERAFQKTMKLGVLPGDELCTVTAFCSYPAVLEDFKKKCEADGNEESQALGQFACVRKTQRGEEYAYTYRTIDNETQCIFEVMGGPSVTEEVMVQSCARAALDTITPENIKNFH